MPTVERLISQSGLGLRLVNGDPDIEFMAIRDVDSPRDRLWLAHGDLRLSEAPYRQPRPDPDPHFIERPAALGYALTPRWPELPQELVERARERNLVLFTVPATVSLQRVEEAALRLVADEARGGLAGAAALNRFLLGALSGVRAERDLLERLARLSGLDLVLLAPWGETMARAGEGRLEQMEVPANRLESGRYLLAGRPALVVRIEHGGRLLAVLVALGADMTGLPLIEASVSLLRVALLERSAVARRDRGERAELLAAWLSAPDAELLGPRLRAAGFDLSSRITAVVAEAGALAGGAERRGRSRRALVEEMRQVGDEYLLGLGVGVLSEIRDDHCLWVCGLQGSDKLLSSLARALESGSGAQVRVAASSEQHPGQGPATVYFQATVALRSIQGKSGTARFEALDPLYWALQQQPPAQLRALSEGLVGALRRADEDGRLWQTLKRYLSARDGQAQLARELGIHPNTLRYRLKRIEELIGRSLANPETLAQLYLAERIDRLLDES